MAKRVLPSGGDRQTSLAPGMLISIYGENLGPAKACDGMADNKGRETPSPQRPIQVPAETLIYPAELCGVQVMMGDAAAGLLYVSARQINFKVPQQTPVEGTADIRVVYRGQSSDPVPVKLGLHFATLSQTEPAFAGMPVWIDIRMPFGWDRMIQYPVSLVPSDLGCSDLEVRRFGKLLPRIVVSPAMDTFIRVGGGPGPCGLLGLPRELETRARIPLHLLYRFDRPGMYEVRFIRYTSPRQYYRSQPGPIVADSEWTSIEVRAPAKNQREQWLVQMSAAHPSDTVDLLTSFLPSVLGLADEPSLAVQQYLYHPNSLVRRYAMNGLMYWPNSKVAETVERLMKNRGPSDVIAEYICRKRELAPEDADRLVRLSFAYFPSESSVLLRGAVILVSRLVLRTGSPVSAAVRAEAESKMIGAEEHILRIADSQTVVDFTSSLAQIKDKRAHDLLWRLAEAPETREQALIAITWRHDPDDLPRLSQFLHAPVYGLPYALDQAYGPASIPYLEAAILDSKQMSVRTNCARELMLFGRPAGFAFMVDAIEHNRAYKLEMMSWVRDRFAEARGLDEPGLLAFLKQRAQ